MIPRRRSPEGAPTARPRALADADVERVHVPPNGGVPNHPVLPALILPGALGAESADAAGIERIEALFESNRWVGAWAWTVYPYHHFHPGSHEVLAAVRGRATLLLGGPAGEARELVRGDVVVLPAGFGHRRLDASDDFTVVGAYPEGQENCETVRAGDAAMRAALPAVRATPLPATDPVHGPDGPLTRLWGQR